MNFSESRTNEYHRAANRIFKNYSIDVPVCVSECVCACVHACMWYNM